uniref:AB hydrolase-1 domain-containing protein n=1 Tax=Panagrellus redivivus TaxID=6233 RepID=A0A7E4V5V2_PANRE
MDRRSWSSFLYYVFIDAILFLLTSGYTIVALGSLALSLFKTGPSFFRKEKVPKPEVLKFGWKHGFADLSEIRMHYVEAGDSKAPLMLLIHGFPEFWYSWRHQLKYFAKSYHVVAIDMRGYGQTSKPDGIENYDIKNLIKDVVEVMLATGHGQAYIVAHDWGANVAWYLAAVHPELVKKLIILNMPHPTSFIKELTSSKEQFFKSWYMFFFQFPYFPEFFFEHTSNKNLIGVFTHPPSGLINSENFTPEDADAWRYTFQERNSLTEPINYYRAAKRRLCLGTTIITDLIKPETLIIWGAKDSALNLSAAEDSLTRCEKATIKIILNASHWVQQDEPDLVNEYIEDFLSGDE